MSRLPIQFPLRGVSEDTPYSKQALGATFNAQNVIPFDSDERLRGASRPPLSKLLASAVNGTAAIQRLVQGNVATIPGSSSDSVKATDAFTYSNGSLETNSGGNWLVRGFDTYGASDWWDTEASAGTGLAEVDTNRVRCGDWGGSPADSFQWVYGIRQGLSSLGSDYYLEIEINYANTAGVSGVWGAGLAFRINTPTQGAAAEALAVVVYATASSDVDSVRVIKASTSDDDQPLKTESGLGITPAGDTFILRVEVRGNDIEAFVDGVSVLTYTTSDYSGNTNVGFISRTGSPSAGQYYLLDDFEVGTLVTGTQSGRDSYLVAVSGGNIYQSDSPLSSMSLATNGTGVLNASTPFMSAVEAPPSPSDTGGVEIQRHIYFCDGTHYKRLNLETATVSAWTAAAGDLPADDSGNTGRIMVLWRGRIVITGILEDPGNWFMSAVYDALDFDYLASPTTVTQAVAGSNSAAGKVADIITALIPANDDTLIFGGDHTIWQMSGDPAEGGRIDNISHQAGVLGQDAWAQDTYGNIYMMTTAGLLRLRPGSATPEPVSAGKLDKTFKSIDRSLLRTILAWDRDREGLYIFTVSVAQPSNAPTAYWYDARTDGFWPLKYPVVCGPTAVLTFDGDAPDDRALLFGGRDSFIRIPDNSATDDAVTSGTTPVESFVDIGPIYTEAVDSRVMVSDLRVVLSEDSDPIEARLYAGATVEDAVNSTAIRAAKTLRAGLNGSIRQRVTGNAVRLRLYQNTAGYKWAFERGDMEVKKVGRQRRPA